MTYPPPGYPPQPPYGGQPPQPPYGGQPPGPPPTPVVKRIPEDQPFVVRPNLVKRGLLLGGVLLAALGPIICCVGLGLLGPMTVEVISSDFLGLVIILGCLIALIALPVGLQLWLIGSGGPVLALSYEGLWIRSRPTRGQAIWLPWEAVALISRRRWSLEKMLVIKPHSPATMPNLGGYTAFDSAPLNLLYGSGLVATLNFADKPEAEILAAVAHYSAGRCHLT
ncbi:hypothetical protein [Micromonospora craniellae]|uniref:PH domain-containing protein n=1 Tax=Micromonospora craniellae TaxID=2294034 RepID=A0A372FTC8_9ACTN|nr:hypothetical protein [Micromonospora craniellae]QOC93646.1 hypothetical protein ID554_08430 [Micromonospora craniellae]RFS43968.1 hypothetical protein D0Q02_24650 [Micromonospora craniellae]